MIRQLADVAEEDGSSVTHQGKQQTRFQLLRDTAEKLEKNEFILAVVGEFSRGKSSMINAILERPSLLPTSIEPSTAAITVLRYGPEERTAVTFKDGTQQENLTSEQLSTYVLGKDLDGGKMRAEVTRRAFDAQRKGQVENISYDEISQVGTGGGDGHTVRTVDLQLPSPFLKDGICLVDTPGIGSINPEHGEATRGFIHRADAVIFLINTDPVISQSECNFLAFLRDYVNRFLFVVTKIDRFNEAERNQSVSYSARIIEEYGGIPDPPMFPLSAKMAVDARDSHDEAKFEASGFPTFLHELEVFLVRARGQEFIQNQVNDALTHLRDLKNSMGVELQGLDLSQDELEKRLAAARPSLERAQTKGQEILQELERRVRRIKQVVSGFSGVDDLRLYYQLRDEVSEEVDKYDWDHLQHASQTIPVFVRDRLQQSLQERLDQITARVVSMRDDILKSTHGLVGEMNQELAAQFEALRVPHRVELPINFNPEAFSGDLKKAGTITIGGGLALTVATMFAFGGVGAIVILGGVLARHTITANLRNRVKAELKKTLDPALNKMIEDLFANITKQVDEHLESFRADIESVLDSAIANVDATLKRLEAEFSSAEFDRGGRQEQLRGRLAKIEALEGELSLIVGPGW